MLLFALGAARAGVGLASLAPTEIVVGAPAASPAAEEIPVEGPFRLVGASQGVRSYEAPLPIRPRTLFFERAPEGMTLRRGAAALKHGDDAGRAGTWGFTDASIVVRVREDAPRPRAGTFTLSYPAAQEREDALHPPADPAGNPAFVVRSAQVDDVTRSGVYLPAPSAITWAVAVPVGGVLDFEAGILPPEVADGTRSDGAFLEVAVDGAVVRSVRVEGTGFARQRVDLTLFGGRTVALSLRTRDDDVTRDQVFVAAPAVVVPQDAPRRLVLVFVDTLRRDHLGVYGYSRAASPKIDAWARSAVVFDQTRSVAPWTLPSARALLSGVQPEFWEGATTLPQRLGAAGWATGAYVGNVYLSSNFDMAEGWSEHGCINWPSAAVEVERSLDFLARNADRDAMLMVHLMDMHLPYKEPRPYRRLYAGAPPAGLGELFTRGPLLTAARVNRRAVRDYIVDRYDQNLRYVDDQVARLLGAVGDDAIVAFFSDHGEEFFDHGDLEHGHSLHDELLRVPMILKGPGLSPRHVAAPTSLVDLTPTLLDLLEMPAPGLSGRSLAGLARGEDGSAFTDRAIAFGRPLYGDEGWGSLRRDEKYTSRSGVESLFDVGGDPGETADLRAAGASADAGRAALAEGLDRPVRLVWRLRPTGPGGGSSSVVMHVPGGARAWVGADPTNNTDACVEMVDEETVRARFESYRGAHREVFVASVAAPESIVGEVTLRVRPSDLPVPLSASPYRGSGEVLAVVREARRAIEATWAVVPLPAGKATSGYDAELKGALQALGYLQEDGAPAAPAEDACEDFR